MRVRRTALGQRPSRHTPVLAEVDFNVSEAFVPLSTPNSNHASHTGNDCDSGTLERKRPASMAVMEGDLVKRERCVCPAAAAPAGGLVP